jgi:hypothetical protein
MLLDAGSGTAGDGTVQSWGGSGASAGSGADTVSAESTSAAGVVGDPAGSTTDEPGVAAVVGAGRAPTANSAADATASASATANAVQVGYRAAGSVAHWRASTLPTASDGPAGGG